MKHSNTRTHTPVKNAPHRLRNPTLISHRQGCNQHVFRIFQALLQTCPKPRPFHRKMLAKRSSSFSSWILFANVFFHPDKVPLIDETHIHRLGSKRSLRRTCQCLDSRDLSPRTSTKEFTSRAPGRSCLFAITSAGPSLSRDLT